MITKLIGYLLKSRTKKHFAHDRLLDLFDEKKKLLNMASDRNEQLRIANEMQSIANRTKSLRGWPHNARVFWDNEADIWKLRIDKRIKSAIEKELKKSEKNKKNILELGCGNTPYLENSTGLDISYQMLLGADNKNKVQANAKNLPFRDSSFDAIAAVFVFNYIRNLEKAIDECRRVLKKNGKLIIIGSAEKIGNYHEIVEQASGIYLEERLADFLNNNGFIHKTKTKMFGKKKISIIVASVRKR